MQTERSNTYTAPYPAINEVASREFDNLVLLYDSSDRDELNALGFRVYRTQRRIERTTNPPSLDAQGNANDTLDFGYFGDDGHSQDVSQPGSDVFRIDNERDKTLIEYGFAVEPDGVLTAIQTGDGSAVIGLRKGAQRSRGFGPEDFSERGAADSDVTRTDTTDEVATTALSPNPHRQGLFRIDSKQDGLNPFRFGFANTTNASVDVSVTGYAFTYDVRPVDDEAVVRDMVTPEGTPARKVTYGGLQNSNPNLPRDWFDSRINVDISSLPASA